MLRTCHIHAHVYEGKCEYDTNCFTKSKHTTYSMCELLNLTSIRPCIANIFAEYNQQDATFHSLFISVRRSTCFRWVFRPSSGAQNCTYRVRYWSDKYLTLYVQVWAPDDGRKNRLKHVERLTEINKLWNVASCWLYTANVWTSLRIFILLKTSSKINDNH